MFSPKGRIGHFYIFEISAENRLSGSFQRKDEKGQKPLANNFWLFSLKYENLGYNFLAWQQRFVIKNFVVDVPLKGRIWHFHTCDITKKKPYAILKERMKKGQNCSANNFLAYFCIYASKTLVTTFRQDSENTM